MAYSSSGSVNSINNPIHHFLLEPLKSITGSTTDALGEKFGWDCTRLNSRIDTFIKKFNQGIEELASSSQVANKLFAQAAPSLFFLSKDSQSTDVKHLGAGLIGLVTLLGLRNASGVVGTGDTPAATASLKVSLEGAYSEEVIKRVLDASDVATKLEILTGENYPYKADEKNKFQRIKRNAEEFYARFYGVRDREPSEVKPFPRGNANQHLAEILSQESPFVAQTTFYRIHHRENRQAQVDWENSLGSALREAGYAEGEILRISKARGVIAQLELMHHLGGEGDLAERARSIRAELLATPGGMGIVNRLGENPGALAKWLSLSEREVSERISTLRTSEAARPKAVHRPGSLGTSGRRAPSSESIRTRRTLLP